MEEHYQPPARLTCKNCSTELAGENYCPVCGQKGDTHVLTFRELLEELADGLFNMDSRLWRSLLPLALIPGRLTLVYLRGRRMYYLPPFRLYLILSVLFFLIPSGNGTLGGNLGDGLSDESEDTNIVTLSDVMQESDIGTEGAEFARQVREEIARELAAAREEDPEAFIETDGEMCSIGDLPTSLFTIVIRDTCLKFQNDPERLWQEVVDMVPLMMILGIPLVALFMHVVYAFSGRYYVEHVIFLFHTHAFFFLISITMSLSSIIGQRYGILFDVMDWFRVIAGWYIPIYIFMAMMKVYGDSWAKTFFKGWFVIVGYGISIFIVAGLGILYTAVNA